MQTEDKHACVTLSPLGYDLYSFAIGELYGSVRMNNQHGLLITMYNSECLRTLNREV